MVIITGLGPVRQPAAGAHGPPSGFSPIRQPGSGVSSNPVSTVALHANWQTSWILLSSFVSSSMLNKLFAKICVLVRPKYQVLFCYMFSPFLNIDTASCPPTIQLTWFGRLIENSPSPVWLYSLIIAFFNPSFFSTSFNLHVYHSQKNDWNHLVYLFLFFFCCLRR